MGDEQRLCDVVGIIIEPIATTMSEDPSVGLNRIVLIQTHDSVMLIPFFGRVTAEPRVKTGLGFRMGVSFCVWHRDGWACLIVIVMFA